MVELATILVGVVVPLIIGPLSVFCKSLWDRYSNSRALKKKNKYETKMKELTDKINLFYWPVYLKLKTLDRISYENCVDKNCDRETKNYQIDIGNGGQTSATDYSSDNLSSSVIPNNNLVRKKRKKWKKCENPNCQRINRQHHLSKFCHICQNKGMNNVNLNNKNSSVDEILSETEDILDGEGHWDNYELNRRQNTFQSMRHINFHNDENVEDDNILVTVDSALLEELDKKILSISLEIKLLVETNISIVQPSRKLIKEIVRFARYTEMLQIINEAKKKTSKKYNIHNYGVVNNTNKFHIIVRNELEKLMLEYKTSFEEYNTVTSLTSNSCCTGKR